jgi:hypothetical protein
MGEVILTFIACYFLLLGLRLMVGSVNDPLVLLGDFFASLALTFFWSTRKNRVGVAPSRRHYFVAI